MAPAQAKLINLHKFSTLSIKNKLLLYKSTVLPTLTYPTVPLNTLSTAQMTRLQRIQNQALRFITNTNILDMIPSSHLHSQLNIEPINLITHKQAHDTWTRIQDTNPRLYTDIHFEATHITNPHLLFKSSRIQSEQPTPSPIFA